ncbi:hypothetical protein BDQ17DRAFT_1323686 [Cyathus striatus]|nr:hypothetical protein BDQ17DRAFT_1323686 [Cyathus striatus]
MSSSDGKSTDQEGGDVDKGDKDPHSSSSPTPPTSTTSSLTHPHPLSTLSTLPQPPSGQGQVAQPVVAYASMPMHMYPYAPGLLPPEPLRSKRRQVKNACTNCQKACKKCDDARPCLRCVKYGVSDECVDSQRKERKKGVKRGPYKKRDDRASKDIVEPQLQAMSSTSSPVAPPQAPPTLLPTQVPYVGVGVGVGYPPAYYGQPYAPMNVNVMQKPDGMQYYAVQHMHPPPPPPHHPSMDPQQQQQQQQGQGQGGQQQGGQMFYSPYAAPYMHYPSYMVPHDGQMHAHYPVYGPPAGVYAKTGEMVQEGDK